VTKIELIDAVARGTGLTKMETKAIVEGVLTTIGNALKRGENVEIRGFGTFQVRYRRARRMRNPRTGQVIDLPHRKVPFFKPSPELKKFLNE